MSVAAVSPVLSFAASLRLVRRTALSHLFLLALALGSFGQLLLFATPARADTTPILGIETGGHSAPIRGLDVSPDGRLAITVSDDRSARVWDLSTGQVRQVIRPASNEGLAGKLYGVAIHPTEDLVAIGGSTDVQPGRHQILLVRLSTGEFVGALDARGGDVTRLRWTADGQALLAIFRGEPAFRAFARDGRMLFEERYKQAAYGLDVSAQGLIATASYDGFVHQYRFAGGQISAAAKIRTETPAPRGVAYSPDGRWLAVGYRGVAGNQGAPSVHDASTGQRHYQLPRPKLAAGNLATVAWSPDGRSLYAAGSGYENVGAHDAYQYDLASRALTAQATMASNTITALTPLANGQIAYASFDGSWGQASATLAVTPRTGAIADFRGPANLRISADASRVGVFTERNAKPLWFDLGQRLVTAGALPGDLAEPRTSAGFFGGAEWENTRQPKVNGQAIELASDELSRSIAFHANSKNAVLGTSKRLVGIDPNGKVRWARPLTAEAWSVNISADDGVVVAALADGTVRWWRTDDGTPLLSLLMLADGRWILWSASGFYDASAGADRLAGWSVNRADQPTADFFSLNRFRARFNKPALLDQVLSLRDEGQALAILNRPVQPAAAPVAQAPAPQVEVRPVLTEAEKLELRKLFLPPVLSSEGPAVVSADAASPVWTIPFTIRAQSEAEVEVRIDGRPAPDADVQLRDRVGSVTRAIATVRQAAPGVTVQLIAKDEYGVSEPLGVRIANVVNAAAATAASSAGLAEPSTPVPALPTPVAPAGAPAAAPPLPGPVAVAPGTAAGTGKRLVVLSIGISQYREPSYQLGLAAKDATDFANTLAAQQGKLYDQVDTRLLTDNRATGEHIKAGFKWLEQSVGPNDLGILFMAGHGLNTPQGEYFFLPWNGDHRQLETTGVPEGLIRGALSRMRGKALMFVDTCYAGGALGNFKTASRELASLANDLASSENGVVVFASSTGRQLSEENDKWGNGAFTRAVIDGLTGKADFRNTGRVTFKSLDFYISEQVSSLTEGRQTPVTISPIGVPDFALTRTL